MKLRSGGPASRPSSEKSSSSNSVLLIVLGVGVAVLLMCGGVLLALLLPAVQQAREAARMSQSTNNLKQLGLALHNYHDTHQTFPPGGVFDAAGNGQHGWQTMLLPFVDAAPLYSGIDFNRPWDDPANAPHFRQQIPAYLSPSVDLKIGADGYALSHYAGNALVFGPNSSLKIREVNDGLSNTMLAGEAAGDYLPWGHPHNWRDPTHGLNTGPHSFGRPGGGSCIVLMMDGSVRVIDNSVDPQVLKAISTPNGAEPAPQF